MNTVARVRDYSGLVAEFTIYLKEKKSYWLAPIIFVLMALSALAFFLEGSVLAPAIYSVFYPQSGRAPLAPRHSQHSSLPHCLTSQHL